MILQVHHIFLDCWIINSITLKSSPRPRHNSLIFFVTKQILVQHRDQIKMIELYFKLKDFMFN